MLIAGKGSLRAGLLEGYLPIVTANMVIRGVDGDDGYPIEELNEMDMIWDTSADRTVIAEEILSPEFRENMKSPVQRWIDSAGRCQALLSRIPSCRLVLSLLLYQHRNAQPIDESVYCLASGSTVHQPDYLPEYSEIDAAS
jgi:hypothetical protein